ncbi:amino acid permease [Acidothermaceae bacterium B102]|nr:amino acid permease [Acidothermaceae bacterium B102]
MSLVESTSVESTLSDPEDVGDLHEFGYSQSLRRTMGPFASFAVAFSMISITTAIFFLLPSLFGTSGAVGVWLWIPCAAGVFLIVLVYAHLASRIPITGFAYQWNSRLINPHYGWFTGYTALLAFMAGTAATAVALASVFASDVWTSPTHGDIVLFATVSLAVAALINIVSIRAVSAVNNVGVVFEIVGSIGAALLLIVGSFFFHHKAGLSILTSTHRTTGGALWYGFVLAALLPLYCFIGWEGAADLAEETNDPRSVTPYAMIRANYVSVGASLLMIVGFLIAIPHGVNDMLGQSKNPLIYIFQSHFGAVSSNILQVIVFLAIFSCVLANMVVATRLTFALSRDGMLPGSGVLGTVNTTTRTPIASIVVVAAVAIGINMLSAGIAANVVSICSVAYYCIYVLTVAGAIYSHRKGRMPYVRKGDFSLGRWFMPVAGIAFVYATGVVVIALAPHEGHTAAKYLLGAEVFGTLWYLLYLRPRIANNTVGVYRQQVIELEPASSAPAAQTVVTGT